MKTITLLVTVFTLPREERNDLAKGNEVEVADSKGDGCLHGASCRAGYDRWPFWFIRH